MESFETLQNALAKLEIIKSFVNNAYINNLITDTPYLRVSAGLKLLRYNLINHNLNINENDYEISLPHLIEIINTANDINIDSANMPVIIYLKQEEDMLKQILRQLYNQDTLTDELAAQIINNINKLN